ncbi:unnamed protein product, partial [Phaeothamnion confervicola]
FAALHTRPTDGVPEIAFAIPIHHQAEMAVAAVASCLAQRGASVEVLCVLDGGGVEVHDALAPFAADPRVRMFAYPKASGGAARGRNKAILEACAPIVAFLDHDDLADPDRAALTLAALAREGTQAVFGSWRARKEPGRSVEWVGDDEIWEPAPDAIANLERTNGICLSTVAVERRALLSVGGFRARMHYREDHELWLRLVASGVTWSRIAEPLSTYRFHSGNTELRHTAGSALWHQLALD